MHDFREGSKYWKLDRNNQWSYVNSLAKKYWGLRIELQILIMRPVL